MPNYVLVLGEKTMKLLLQSILFISIIFPSMLTAQRQDLGTGAHGWRILIQDTLWNKPIFWQEKTWRNDIARESARIRFTLTRQCGDSKGLFEWYSWSSDSETTWHFSCERVMTQKDRPDITELIEPLPASVEAMLERIERERIERERRKRESYWDIVGFGNSALEVERVFLSPFKLLKFMV